MRRSPTPANDVRRVLVVISDGEDTLSHHSRGEALEIAQRAGIVIYTISSNTDWIVTDQETNPSKSVDRKYEKDPGDQVLQQFAEDSGGRAFFPYHVDDLAQSFAQIGDELRSQYSLAYTLPSGQLTDGKFHTIRIAVAPRDCRCTRAKATWRPGGWRGRARAGASKRAGKRGRGVLVLGCVVAAAGQDVEILVRVVSTLILR